MSDVVPPTEAIFSAMQTVLDSINSVYEQEGIELPSRQYLTVGEVVHDCEQLVIAFLQMYSGSPGDQAEAPTRCSDPRSIVLQISLVRCIPTVVGRGSAPTPEALNESTARLMSDAYLLLDGAMASQAVEFLGGLGDVAVSPASGGFQAIEVNLVTAIP